MGFHPDRPGQPITYQAPPPGFRSNPGTPDVPTSVHSLASAQSTVREATNPVIPEIPSISRNFSFESAPGTDPNLHLPAPQFRDQITPNRPNERALNRPNATQLNAIQPNPTQPNATQPNATQLNATLPTFVKNARNPNQPALDASDFNSKARLRADFSQLLDISLQHMETLKVRFDDLRQRIEALEE
jgi:hypothetical protein